MKELLIDNIKAFIFAALIIIIFLAWFLPELSDTTEREAAERHGQSGSIGGGWGNSGRD